MKKMTTINLLRKGDVWDVGDFTYYSRAFKFQTSRYYEKIADKLSPELLKEIFGNDIPSMGFRFLKMCSIAGNVWQRPEWLDKLPTKLRRMVAEHRQMMISSCVCPAPFAGFGFTVDEDGFIQDIYNTFNLHRLQGIRQLALLHDPVLREQMPNTSRGMPFDHTRFLHSLQVASIMNLIMERNALSKSEKLHGIVAGLSHDYRTPAGGDATKLIDPKAFDEDAHYGEVFETDKWKCFKETYNMDEILLRETILNKGLLGQLLDVADKIAYVGMDTFKVMHGYEYLSEKSDYSSGYHRIGEIISKNPNVCTLWDKVKVKNGEVYHEDCEKVADFLKLRAILFKDMYYNPNSRIIEYMLSKKVVAYLYKTGVVTLKGLLTNTDWWLEQKVGEFMGLGEFALGRFFWNWEGLHVDLFDSIEDAQKAKNILDTEEDMLVILDDFVSMTGSAVKKWKVKKGRHIISFADAFPEKANEIEELIRFPKQVRLYSVNLQTIGIPSYAWAKLKSI